LTDIVLITLTGRKVAIDASMSIYQFLIAVRSEGANLTNDDGETTSHLSGLFYRTIRMINHGIKPVYVGATSVVMVVSWQWLLPCQPYQSLS
jgi:hypothetical protein